MGKEESDHPKDQDARSSSKNKQSQTEEPLGQPGITPTDIKIIGGGGEVVVPAIEVDKDFSVNSISSYFIDSVKQINL
eukprot:CAMPEP_0170564056 /NCGR_PEP_ID=MMETSP0211-20121228/70647_1 /TAXON_ID=311385 /ORGANISM="Pseudokeronopsis sp., Strain OXSARD2" /LENGTH=77 /DNA_ID=CAMNT_0010883037 /DNA_START=482 /DNA_END=711 /DNA_ORIENTATION=+